MAAAHTLIRWAGGASLGAVQALLGHASPEVTREIYIVSVPENARTAVKDIKKLIGPKMDSSFGLDGNDRDCNGFKLRGLTVGASGRFRTFLVNVA